MVSYKGMTPARGSDYVSEHVFEQMRRAMVTGQLRTTAVNDPRVVRAMASVPRERYVAAGAAALAYRDLPLPLGRGRAMAPPMVTGRLLTEARVRPVDVALVIGAGSGYAAAVLALLAARVTALEEADGPRAAAALPAEVARVEGPLARGWADGAPYDVILIDGAVARVPDTIISQLRDGGRLATGLVQDGVTRLAIGRRSGDSFGLTAIADAEVPTLPGFAPPVEFSF